MSTAYPPMDPGLSQRLDDLELRVAFLEDVTLDADEPEFDEPDTQAVALSAAAAAGGGDWDADTVAVASGDPGPMPRAEIDHDLRELQRAATVEASPQSQHSTDDATPTFDLAYIEERLAGRVLALVGGAALVLGAVFFLSLAFSRGWISPGLQVSMGIVGGSTALLLGGVLLLRGDRNVGHVLTAVGLAVISLAFFAATTLYGLVPPVVGLAGTLGAAAATTAIAIAARSQVVAGFGLVAVLAAPPILEAPADQLTLAYMVIVLGGVAVVSLRQTWSWLPVVAFALSAPQVWAWIASEPTITLGFSALLLYWGLLAVASGGEAYRQPRAELPLASAPLFMASGAFVVVMAFQLLPLTQQQVAFLLTLATLHGLIGLFFALRRGPVAPFGLLAGGYGVALASMAVPLLFGASLTAAVWAAEAAALALLASRRAHGPSLLAGLGLLSLAAVRIALIASEARPLLSDQTATLIGPLPELVASWVFLVAVGCAFVIAVPVRSSRLTVTGIVALASVPVVYHELESVAVVAGWTLIAVIAVTSSRWLARLPERPIDWQLGPALEWLRPRRSLKPEAEAFTVIAAAVAGGLALAATSFATLAQSGRPNVPFSDAAGQSALIVATGCLMAGLIVRDGRWRRGMIIVAGAVLGIAALFQLPLLWAAVWWTAAATIAFVLGRLDARGSTEYLVAGAVALGAVALAGMVIAPPGRLVVGIDGLAAHPPFISEASLVLGVLVLGLVLASRLYSRAAWARGALATAGVAGLYLLSVGMVDIFAAEVSASPSATSARVDELAKEAHVALSILWAVVGVAVTGAGLLLKSSPLRIAGLTVLALATAKVFLFDLASLDIAYRVITLLVLGVVLIASAWAWSHLKPAVAAAGTSPASGGAAGPQTNSGHD